MSSVIRFVISACFIIALFFMLKDQWAGILDALRDVHIAYFLLGFSIVAAGCVLMGWRLKFIFSAQEMTIRFKEAVHATYVGLFFNNFLPTAIGGDVVKAYCISKSTGQRTRVFGSIFMDRIMGLSMFVLIPTLTVVFLIGRLDRRIVLVVIAAFLVTSVGLALIFFKDKLEKLKLISMMFKRLPTGKIGQLYHVMHELTAHKEVLLKVCFVALVVQLMNIFAISWILKSIGSPMPMSYLLLAIPVIHLLTMIPSINGLGVREGGFIYFFKDHIGEQSASAMAILYLSYLIMLSFVGGVIYLFRTDYHFDWKKIRNNQKEQKI